MKNAETLGARQGSPTVAGLDLPALSVAGSAAVRPAAAGAAAAGTECLSAKAYDYVFAVVANALGGTSRRPLRVTGLAPVGRQDHFPSNDVFVCGLGLIRNAVGETENHRVPAGHRDANDLVLEPSLIGLRKGKGYVRTAGSNDRGQLQSDGDVPEREEGGTAATHSDEMNGDPFVFLHGVPL
jgi:hypothetical protein